MIKARDQELALSYLCSLKQDTVLRTDFCGNKERHF